MPPMAGSGPPAAAPSAPEAAAPPQAAGPPDEQLARIEAGAIPLAAERRLNALRTGGAFTSNLSTADFALCHQAGLRPLAQVMGTSVYQIGWDPRLGWGGAGGMMGGQVSELSVLTRAYNQARLRALDRLASEALAVGADAVVGATWHLAHINFGDQEGSLEYTIVGTAVRRQSAEAGSAAQSGGEEPVLTDLSVADYVKLLRAGIEPVGLAGWHSVFFTETSLIGGALVQSLAGRQFRNFELVELTQTIYAAREQVMQRDGHAGAELRRLGHRRRPARAQAHAGKLHAGRPRQGQQRNDPSLQRFRHGDQANGRCHSITTNPGHRPRELEGVSYE